MYQGRKNIMGEKKKIYKSEDSKTIYEFLKKKDEECE